MPIASRVSETRRDVAFCMLACAGLTVSSTSFAQNVFHWNTPHDGSWHDPSRWSTVTVPGLAALNDRATLGLSGAYEVLLYQSVFMDSVTLANEDASLRLRGGAVLDVHRLDGHGRLIVGQATSPGILRLRAGGTASADITLDGLWVTSAQIRGPVQHGAAGTIAPGSTITGTGLITGGIVNGGLIAADTPGDVIEIRPSAGTPLVQTEHGRLHVGNGGEIRIASTVHGGAMFFGASGRLNGTGILLGVSVVAEPGWVWASGTLRAEGSTFESVFEVQPGCLFEVGAGNSFHQDGIVVRGGLMQIDDDITVNTRIRLEPGGDDTARIEGESSFSPTGRIGPDGVVSGTGSIGPLFSDGLVLASTPSDDIGFRLYQSPDALVRVAGGGRVEGTIFGGRLVIDDATNVGQLRLNNVDAEISAETALTETLFASGTRFLTPFRIQGTTFYEDGGNTYHPDGLSLTDSRLVLAEGTRFDGAVFIDNTSIDSLSGTLDTGELGEASRVTGSGTLLGRVQNHGVVTARGEGAVIRIRDTRHLANTLSKYKQGASGVLRAEASGTLDLPQRLRGGSLSLASGGTVRGLERLEDVAVTIEPDAAWPPGELTLDDCQIFSTGDLVIPDGASPVFINGSGLKPQRLVIGEGTGASSVTLGPGMRLNIPIHLHGERADDAALIAINDGEDPPALGAGATIIGRGSIRGPFLNSGRVTADGPGSEIIVRWNGSFSTFEQSASGVVEATNGGRLVLNRVRGGRVWVDRFSSARGELYGVRFDCEPGWDEAGGYSYLYFGGSTISGLGTVAPGSFLRMGPGNTLDRDEITVLGGQSPGFLAVGSSLPMPYSVRLAGTSPESAILLADASALRAAPGTTISGTGSIQGSISTIDATVRPDPYENEASILIDPFNYNSPFDDNESAALLETAAIEIPLVGPERSGRITLTTEQETPTGFEFRLGGTLRILPDEQTFSPGFTTFDVIGVEDRARIRLVGVFDHVEYAGELPSFLVVRVHYAEDRITAALTCPTDLVAPLLVTDILDVIAFLELWSAGDASADFQGDGVVDEMDVLAFLAAWDGCLE